MTVSHRKARPSGGAYYIDGLKSAAIESNAEAGTVAAEWVVSGPTEDLTRELLKVTCGKWREESDVAAFLRLVQGRCVGTPGNAGEFDLVQNAGSPKRVALHDFTLSAPKSVSVVWAFADQETRRLIEQAQLRAARAFVSLLGHHATYSRQGKAGRIKTRCALVAALFPHFTSRRGDPQLHTHCTLLNVAVRPDRSTGGLETLDVMRLMGVAASAYHDVLSDGLRAAGFLIVEGGNLFEIEGVSELVCKTFSQGRAIALDEAHRQMRQVGQDPLINQPSRRLMKNAVIRTRPKKTGQHHVDLTQTWLRRLAAAGWSPANVSGTRNRQRVSEDGSLPCTSKALLTFIDSTESVSLLSARYRISTAPFY